MTVPRQFPRNYISTHQRLFGPLKDYIKHGYIRFGIYYVAQYNGRMQQVNFFDLHFLIALLDNEHWRGWYSGAKKSIFHILDNNSFRKQTDEDQLLASDTVDERYRLSNGGIAGLYPRRKGGYSTWLFGPLWFGAYNLGSLRVKLDGLVMPRGKTRHRDEMNSTRLLFPQHFGTRQGRCTLWGSYYTGAGHSYHRGYEAWEDIRKQAKHVFPVDPGRHYTWRIEAYSGELTFDEAEHQRDKTKHKLVRADA